MHGQPGAAGIGAQRGASWPRRTSCPASAACRPCARLADSQVRVSLMTNSLATTDEPLVHFGYARYRQALLDMGVALYELMPRPALPDDRWPAGASLGRLHAKLAVVDRRWLSIGSMNMDRRSAHSNTEMALVIDSPALAGQVLRPAARREAAAQLPGAQRRRRRGGAPAVGVAGRRQGSGGGQRARAEVGAADAPVDALDAGRRRASLEQSEIALMRICAYSNK